MKRIHLSNSRSICFKSSLLRRFKQSLTLDRIPSMAVLAPRADCQSPAMIETTRLASLWSILSSKCLKRVPG